MVPGIPARNSAPHRPWRAAKRATCGQATPARVRPIALVLPESGVYPLVTVLLAVLGVYFVAWLAQGGAQEIAAVFH